MMTTEKMIDDDQPLLAIDARGPTLLVCENSGDWALRLQRLLDTSPAAARVRIIETRGAAECLAALNRAPTAMVAVELTASNCEAALDLLVALDARSPQARTAVLAARSMRGYRWLAYELGAVCVVCSPRQLAPLVEMVTRQATAPPCQRDLAPGLALNPVEEIWECLPWQSG